MNKNNICFLYYKIDQPILDNVIKAALISQMGHFAWTVP